MPQIRVTDSQGQQHAVEFHAGDSLMETLRDAGFEEIEAICGGSCSCATCHLHVMNSPEPLPEVEDDESMLLELADGYDAERSRLSCQISLTEELDGMEVVLLDED